MIKVLHGTINANKEHLFLRVNEPTERILMCLHGRRNRGKGQKSSSVDRFMLKPLLR